jgi:hypothetical protein
MSNTYKPYYDQIMKILFDAKMDEELSLDEYIYLLHEVAAETGYRSDKIFDTNEKIKDIQNQSE